MKLIIHRLAIFALGILCLPFVAAGAILGLVYIVGHIIFNLLREAL